MKTKNVIASLLGMGALIYGISSSANDEVKQWMQQQSHGVQAQKEEFQEYKDKRDQEFTAFLKAHWKAVDIVKGEVRDEAPKPEVLPIAQPEFVAKKPADKPVNILVPKTEPIKEPYVVPVIVSPKGERITVDLYGKQIIFYYDARLGERDWKNGVGG